MPVQKVNKWIVRIKHFPNMKCVRLVYLKWIFEIEVVRHMAIKFVEELIVMAEYRLIASTDLTCMFRSMWILNCVYAW